MFFRGFLEAFYSEHAEWIISCVSVSDPRLINVILFPDLSRESETCPHQEERRYVLLDAHGRKIQWFYIIKNVYSCRFIILHEHIISRWFTLYVPCYNMLA